ncbi:hypothetical protein Sango_0413600 [Sesamum angolense]|uniref:MULE transposase domain-containing protein n=1 Tax=Sesamum angolense TaxID=2727404 RepID=A0AAE1XAI2_9LAMI|nr:hypothetical protein Sango_0413600 [Sesamum angolense]
MLEYVDAEQIHVESPPPMSQQWGDINPQMSQQWGVANPQMSNQWGEYMNLLATPGLPPCSNTDYLAGTSNPILVTSNLDFGAGTIVEWKYKGLQASTGKYVMGYVFWAFKPCIDGFQFCRNVISVDGTHLYTKYKYKLLIAAAMDGNQQVLPLAFAVVDEETYPSWKWFLQQLSRHVIRGRRGMCLISDRHAGLIKAVREGPDFVSPHGVHRKFNCIMDEIKKQDVKAFAYLDAINKEKWTASHDGGWRCGILTTNMSECINGVLKGARRLHVSALVEITLERTVHYFHVRAMKGQKMLQNNQLLTDFACKMFISWQQKAVEHTVTKYSHAQQSASVVTRLQGRHGMNTHVVKIAN